MTIVVYPCPQVDISRPPNSVWFCDRNYPPRSLQLKLPPASPLPRPGISDPAWSPSVRHLAGALGRTYIQPSTIWSLQALQASNCVFFAQIFHAFCGSVFGADGCLFLPQASASYSRREFGHGFFFLLLFDFCCTFRSAEPFQHPFTFCVHLCGSNVAGSRIFHFRIQAPGRLMDDIECLGEGSQCPSTQVPIDLDCELESQFGVTQPPSFLPPSVARGRGHGGRGSNTARSSSTPSHSRGPPPQKVRGPNWTEAEMLVLIAQKRIEWDGRHNCN